LGYPHCYDSFCVECLEDRDCPNNNTHCGSRCVNDGLSPKMCTTNYTGCVGSCSPVQLSCIDCSGDLDCNFYSGCTPQNKCQFSLNKSWWIFVVGIVVIVIIVVVSLKIYQSRVKKNDYTQLNSMTDSITDN